MKKESKVPSVDAAQNLDMYWFLKACFTAFSRPDPMTPPLEVVLPKIFLSLVKLVIESDEKVKGN